MKSPLDSRLERARQATACAMIIACLLPLPASAQAQSADKGTLVLAPGVPFNSIEPAGVPGSTRRCDTSAGGFWVGHQAARPWNDPATSHIRRSLANLHDQAITIADRKVTPDFQGYGGRRGRRRSDDRALLGLVLGAVGGFVAGGVIGAEVTSARSCHCDNPGLHGFVVGGSIGAVVGGFLGFALAR